MQEDYFARRLQEEIDKIQEEQLEELTLSMYLTGKIPEQLYKCSSLKKLNLSALPYIDDESVYLSEEYWWEVSFDQNSIGKIDASISKLVHLQELNVSQTGLYEIHENIGKLKQLRKLTLRNNNLAELPATIGELENLEELDVSYNEIQTLPPEIGRLKNLKVLRINSNMLASLPAEMGALSRLEVLNIGNFNIQEIHEETISRFNLKRNHFRGLPKSFSRLTNLQELNIFYDALPREYEEWYSWSLGAFLYQLEEEGL